MQVNFLLHLLGPLFPASPSLLLSTPSSCISDHSHWPFDPCLAADLVKEIANLRFVICRQRLTLHHPTVPAGVVHMCGREPQP